MMNRREYLSAAIAAFAVVPLARSFAAETAPANPALSDDWAAAYAKARQSNPGLIGYDSVGRRELSTPMLSVEGKLPADLVGRFTRNGPAQHEVGGLRYHHWFDGDGMLQQFRFDGKTVGHRGRLIETNKLRTETAAGRAVERTFGTAMPGLRAASSPDAVNVANINVIEHGGRLMALWEAGSAWDINPETLAARGPVQWSRETAGLAFSAHPRIEPDGTLWNFGIAYGPQVMILYHIGADGRLRQAVPVPAPDVGMVHDFLVTARHIVVPMPPLAPDPKQLAAGSAFLDAHVWRKEAPIRVMILPKDDPGRPRFVDLPNGFIFHYGNAWEEADGTIRFDAVLYDDPSLMFETLRYVMRGETRAGSQGRHVAVTIPPRGEAKLTAFNGAVEFPRVDPRHIGRRHRYAFLVGGGREAGAGLGLSSVLRRDLESGAVARYDYGSGMTAEEHVFVPRPGQAEEGDGWVIGTVLDTKAAVTRLAVFDATRLSDGPLAMASLPYALPLGLHGNFAAA